MAPRHESPYPPAPPPGPPPGRLTYAEAWKRLTAVAGLVGLGVLLMRPELRSTEAWLAAGGATGLVPFDRVLDRFGVGSPR